MFSIITTLLSFIPGFTSVLQSWFKAKADVELAKINGQTAVGSAAVAAAAAGDDARAKTWGFISGSKLLTLLIIFLATPIGLYEWKIVVYDTVLNMGTTEPIKGQVADWMNVIIGSVFSSSSVLAVAHLWWTTKD